MKPEEYPRLAITALVLLLFGFAYVRNPSDQLLLGSLISMASLAVQYWLGSSKGAVDANARADKATDLATRTQAKVDEGVEPEKKAK